jgi:hypothetical protein
VAITTVLTGVSSFGLAGLARLADGVDLTRSWPRSG